MVAGEVARKRKALEPACTSLESPTQHGTAKKPLQSMPMDHQQAFQRDPKYSVVMFSITILHVEAANNFEPYPPNQIVGNRNQKTLVHLL